MLSSFAFDYAVDPTGKNRHLDAIHYGSVRPGTEIPGMFVSQRTREALIERAARGYWVRMTADVRFDVRPLRTLVATVTGAERPDEIVYIVAHIDAAGACDNAAGAGGVAAAAASLVRLVERGDLPRPRRSIAFVFGQEVRAGQVVLEHMDQTPIAGVVCDMIGQDLSLIHI